MSGAPEDGDSTRARPKRSLREELASLRIERPDRPVPPRREPAMPRAEPTRPEPMRPESAGAPTAPPGAYRPSKAQRRRGRGRKLAAAGIWLIPLALVAGLGYYAVGRIGGLAIQQGPEVTLALVQQMTAGEAGKLLTAKGYLRSRTKALVGAKVPGRIEQLLVESGMKVQKGDLLAVLEHPELVAALETKKVAVLRAEAELQEALADRDVKDSRAKRQRRLLDQNRSASIEEVERATGDAAMANSRVAMMASSLAMARAEVAEAQEAVDNMKIHAPFSGTILNKEAEAGETISTMSMGGSNTRSAIADLADLEHMEVEADVSENLLSRLTVGLPAEIEVAAVPDRRYRGRVHRIIPLGDRTRGTIKVIVEVLDTDGRLFPELVANVHFLPAAQAGAADAIRSALFVPRDAIVGQGEQTFAWVVDPSHVARKRPVAVVEAAGNLVRVEEGLQAGEQVVLKPPPTLRDGAVVREAQ